MKTTLALVLFFQLRYALADNSGKATPVASMSKQVTFANYMRDNYRILSKRKRNVPQIAFQDEQVIRRIASPDPAPVNNGFSSPSQSGSFVLPPSISPPSAPPAEAAPGTTSSPTTNSTPSSSRESGLQ